MIDVAKLARIASRLSALVIEDAEDAGEMTAVRARDPGGRGRLPWLRHGDAGRRPLGRRRLLVEAPARRPRRPVLDCAVQTIPRAGAFPLALPGQLAAVLGVSLGGDGMLVSGLEPS